ncbi:MAG: 4'-phosphopantetheinyl transferase superfamily protein [Deltaproteobacteria bacterium]|nr:4'-phosphopantetheinyl transferase superfamily protein [Deltaproteobacteria bacterium]
MHHVGNDIVDLTNPLNVKKIDDPRFIKRVLTAAEREQLTASKYPLEILWSFWAAKETAYKVCRKLDLHAAFSPRLYQVSLDEAGERQGKSGIEGRILAGKVSATCGDIRIRVMISREYVHCMGTEGTSGLESMVWEVGRMEGPESEADESSFVRNLAIKGLSIRLEKPPDAIEIKRFKSDGGLGPPFVYIEGKAAPIDISLSHDGPFAAYAFTKISPFY